MMKKYHNEFLCPSFSCMCKPVPTQNYYHFVTFKLSHLRRVRAKNYLKANPRHHITLSVNISVCH